MTISIMLDLITIGDIKLDTFVVLNDASLQCQLKMPECQLCLDYGGKIVVEMVDSQIAGTAPNVAVGLSRMGQKTAVISNMGQDGTRKLSLEKLEKEKVSTRFVRSIKGAKSAYSVVLNFKGEKTLLTAHNQNAYRLPKPLPETKWLYVGEMGNGYEPFFSNLARYVQKKKIRLGINPGTVQISERKPVLFELIQKAEVLFVNRSEAQYLISKTIDEITRLATELYSLGAKVVVVTDGKNGAACFDGKTLLSIDIFPGKLVEATGAGDAFATGFIGALMHGKTAKDALKWGSVNSASVIGQVGPQDGLLSDRQIASRLKKHPSFKPKII
ncbi:carbohydrate kinase family protein [Candidatus Uhrbacteria bacterium]|nr:carbohydrate kinase family protein [Candidatus Uhrbacteria bacterium]